MLPIGSICPYYGNLENLPSGWYFCDGNNGTIDLRGLFLCGTNPPAENSGPSGNSSHVHSFISDGHTHSVTDGSTISSEPGWDVESKVGKINDNTDAQSNFPPYFSVYFVQRIF